jgi:phosphohistidine swiveling domain-containing protein
VNPVKVVPLDAIRSIDEAAIGPKAMSLVRLKRAGLAVPAGFCIAEAVLREHLEHNNLPARLKSLVNELAQAGADARGTLLSNLRRVIIEAPLAEQIRRGIEKHYYKLGAERVAVRSSGTAEDLPGHSFAGQHDSYLGVANLDDCIEAVKKCWASLWTLRAYEYRERNGFDHLNVGMAVIVQTLVAADVSCVIFTADPITGERGSVVIEACFGLGHALVSGKVTPDRFVVVKDKLKLWSRTISDKKIECVPAADGAVEDREIPREKSISPTLHKRQMRRLAALALKIETEFGCPQDIECAISDNRVFLLQSRPITALPPEKSWEDRQIWCCNPAKEVIPDVATPATMSVIDGMLDDFIGPLFGLLCMDRGDHPIHGLVAGRVYFNANIWGAVFRDLPGTKGLDFTKATGSHEGLQKVLEGLRNASPADLPDMKFGRLRFFLKIPLVIAGALANTPKKGRRVVAKVEVRYEKWSRLEAAGLATEEIPACCGEVMADLNEVLRSVLYLFSVLAALPILDVVCNKWLADTKAKAGRLLAGIGGMVDATAGLDIWRLAVAANSSPTVRDLILSDVEWAVIEARLAGTDSGREFLALWTQFMERHGHHCRGELEFYNKRWIETPDYILKFVRSHITQIGKTDPVRNFDAAAEKRKELERQCRKKLRNPIKRLVFNHLLARCQNGSVFRENIKSEVIKLLTTMRKLLLELGKRLSDKDVIRNPDDVFFLRLEEIDPVVKGTADFDVHQVIADRRAEYNRNESITPPDVVFGRFDPETFVPDNVDHDAPELNGLGVSPGAVTGKARVILRADTEEQLLAGEILVAPFTDPGWTPYFVPAAAIVMDEGGVISHGSIIAREYGIPAVVNAGGATRIIKTGQTIRVDGDRGVVTILQ